MAKVSKDWHRAVAEASQGLKPVPAQAFSNGLAGLAAALDDGAQRMLWLRVPSCPQVTADERALLALIGALQHKYFEFGQALRARHVIAKR